jgi:hypothetical protein
LSAKQKGIKMLESGTAPLPQWCPAGLTPTQKRCLQRLRTKKLMEEKAKKEREKNFNAIKQMQSPKKVWKPKQVEKVEEVFSSDDDMDLLDSPLIKDGSPPPEGMDINMVHFLPAEFAIEEEVAQLCLGSKNAVFEKPDGSTKHIKPLCGGTAQFYLDYRHLYR